MQGNAFCLSQITLEQQRVPQAHRLPYAISTSVKFSSRLFFTDNEVYFDCLETTRHEFYQFKGAWIICNTPALPQRCTGSNTKQLDIFQHISAFSERTLGHPSDIIRALAGILHVNDVKFGVAHYWGIPILPEHAFSSAVR